MNTNKYIRFKKSHLFIHCESKFSVSTGAGATDSWTVGFLLPPKHSGWAKRTQELLRQVYGQSALPIQQICSY